MSDLVELKPCPFCNSAPNPVPQNGDVLPGGNGYFQTIWCERCDAEGGKRKTEADAIEAWNRRSALSLPVQPVAWLGEADGFKSFTRQKSVLSLWEKGNVKVTPVYANPVPPTKGPEDDLIAALEVATNALEGLSYIHDGNPSDAMADTPPLEYARHMLYEARQIAKEAVREVLALRSRPASALPVVGEDDERFLLAYVSRDTKIIGIEHPTEADWSEVLAAHVALRDRLNVRIAEQEKCPFNPSIPSVQP